MRIAILADPIDAQQAGIHVYTRQMVEAIVRSNTRHELFIFTRKPHPEIGKAANIVTPVSPLPGHEAWRRFLTLPGQIRRLNMDVALEPAHFGPFNLPSSTRRVTVIHDLTPVLFPGFHPLLSRTLQRLFLPSILRRATAVVTDSLSTMNDLSVRYPVARGKLFTNPPGVEADFRPVHNAQTLRRHGVEEPYFLYVGAIEPRKNLITLLDAYTRFRQISETPARLVFTGPEGWKNRPFFDRLRRHPFAKDIHLTGFVPRADLPALYSLALGFVYPSFYEGFGLPVLEAMRCGAPCLVSRASSLPEVGGAAALYFDPQSTDELCGHLTAVAADAGLKERLRNAGFRQAESFSWESHAQRWLELFDHIEHNSGDVHV
jgi:glycosyltransferase involved in cell wall biosynthesis